MKPKPRATAISQSMKALLAAAIILSGFTLAATASTNDVTGTDPESTGSLGVWADFLPMESLGTDTARKITLSYAWSFTKPGETSIPEDEGGPSPRNTLKKQEIVYPTIYTGRRTSTAGFEKTVFNINLAYMAALNVADYLTTREALKYEGLAEANPVMRPFVGNDLAFAAVKAGLAAGSFLLLRGLYKKNKPLAWAASLVANVALSYVVVNNLRMINSVQPQPENICR